MSSTNHSIGLNCVGEEPNTARDPVCKMEVDVEDAVIEEYAGGTYSFCSEDCAELFRANPESYLPRTAQA